MGKRVCILNWELTEVELEPRVGGGGGEELRIWKGDDAWRKFWIKPLKETNHGVAQDFWPLKKIIFKTY